MLVKQRDNEIGILLNYLNKKKEGAAIQGAADLPVQRASNGFSSNNVTGLDTTTASAQKGEEQKQTLFQMMNGGGTMQKSIKEKRMDFEMNQQTM